MIASVAPSCMVYAPAGTRRQAALAGLRVDSEQYAQWSRTQMIAACNLLFAHGVKHIFTILATPGQFREVGHYRERLIDWIDWGVAGPEALADYCELGWNVRLIGAHEIDDLAGAVERVRNLPRADDEKTLWCWVIPDADASWRWMRSAICLAGRTRQEAIRWMYGQDVPAAGLFLGFGKPVVTDYLFPPLLSDNIQCYWTQRPGYALTQRELRTVLYDYTYLRPTWQADKTLRAEHVMTQRDVWESGLILGVGRRFGPFWYPESQHSQSVTDEKPASSEQT